MPDRDRNTVTQRVTLGDGQINLNGTVLDVNGITFIQDGVEVARFDGEPFVRLDNDAEITATATIDDFGEAEAAMRRLMDNTRAATTATTYNPYFTHEDLQRLIDQVAETPHTYNPYIYSIVTEDEEPELDEKNEKLDGFLGEFIKEAV